MTNRIMLINGRHAEQIRVAVVEGGVLQLYDVEGTEAALRRGNVYRGVVANVERSLNAAFVDFGDDKHGFLTRHDVIPQAYRRGAGGSSGAPIDQVLQKGQPVIVQVTRDAEGGKGATLTTNVSLAGRFLVYFPFDPQRGVSRKVEDEALRRKLREKAKDLDLDEGEGFIVRTNAADQTKADLKADLQVLQRLWKAAVDDAAQGRGPRLLYDDQDLLIHSLRDNLDAGIDEVLIDDERLLERAQRYVHAVMPRAKVELRLYDGPAPLFSRNNVESQIAAIYARTVGLPGGGAIVIDRTEALTAIDVNSGRSKVGKNQGDTAYRANLEAAAEVGRQLRLRDIGGLVVVDFIDMRASKHRHEVEKALREAMKPDRARHRVGRISENGLVEINRQRIRSALQLRTHRLCPTCEGVGRITSPELLGLTLLRRIASRAALGRLARVKVTLHPGVAEHVQNTRRRELADLERAWRIEVEIVGDARAELSTERFEWFEAPQAAWDAAREAGRGAGRDADDDRDDRDDRSPVADAASAGEPTSEVSEAGDGSETAEMSQAGDAPQEVEASQPAAALPGPTPYPRPEQGHERGRERAQQRGQERGRERGREHGRAPGQEQRREQGPAPGPAQPRGQGHQQGQDRRHDQGRDQADAAGGSRSRRKRRRRGRNREGGVQEQQTREWGAPPAASIGSVIDGFGNAAAEAETPPAVMRQFPDAEGRQSPEVEGRPAREGEGRQPREADEGSASSRRRRRRRRRSRGERGEHAAAAGTMPTPPREAPAGFAPVHRDDMREAPPATAAVPRETERTAPSHEAAHAPVHTPERTPAHASVHDSTHTPSHPPAREPVAPRPSAPPPALSPEPGRAAHGEPAAPGETVSPKKPRKQPAAKKAAPKKPATEKAASVKKAKAAPKKPAVRKTAAKKAAPKSQD